MWRLVNNMITNKPKTFQLTDNWQNQQQKPIATEQSNLTPEQGMEIKFEILRFGPILTRFNVPQNIIKQFIDLGNTKRYPENEFNHQLAGHLENEYYLGDEGFNLFFNYLKPYFCAHLHNQFQQVDLPFHVDAVGVSKLWINYMKKGEYNPPHIHKALYSFVLYLDIPENLFKNEKVNHRATSALPGSITFIHGEEQPFIKTTQNYKPKSGDLFIFPANLRHFVAPFKNTEGERVSVSGNIDLSFNYDKPYIPKENNANYHRDGNEIVEVKPDYFINLPWENIHKGEKA